MRSRKSSRLSLVSSADRCFHPNETTAASQPYIKKLCLLIYKALNKYEIQIRRLEVAFLIPKEGKITADDLCNISIVSLSQNPDQMEAFPSRVSQQSLERLAVNSRNISSE